MRRFFRAHRDADYSQIQYLTAKCTRLTHDKAVLDREFLLATEREGKLRNDLEAVAVRLLHQEQINMELRINHDQLVARLHRQQDLVNLLQHRVVLLVEESSRDAELLQQVGSELLCLQSSEVELEGLVEELHAEAQRRAAVAGSLRAELHAEAQRRVALTESLQVELHRTTAELQKLHEANKTLRLELKDLHSAHQKEVRALQQENEGSLRKLQETAEQFEWLCQQQRCWMCCVKRFKDCLMKERAALLRQVSVLENKVEKLKNHSHDDCPLQDTDCHDSGVAPWETDAVADLEARVDKTNMFYEEFFNQERRMINGYQKPP